MTAINTGKLAVFVRSGTIFAGGTQERTSLTSNIVLPGAKVDIKVRCIHSSKGINTGMQVNYGGTTPLEFDQMNYSAGYKYADQHTTWSNVAAFTASNTTSGMQQARGSSMRTLRAASLGARHNVLRGMHSFMPEEAEPMVGRAGDIYSSFLGASSTDDLYSHMEDFSKSFDETLRKVKLNDDQVGLALLTPDGCQTIEVFDVFASWKALHEDAVKRLGPSLAKKDAANVFDYNPEKAVETVKKVLALDFKENVIYEHKPNNGDPHFRVLGLSADPYVGEVVEFDGKAIHVVILKTQKAA
jgi:hypothetical protein